MGLNPPGDGCQTAEFFDSNNHLDESGSNFRLVFCLDEDYVENTKELFNFVTHIDINFLSFWKSECCSNDQFKHNRKK
jgi:hypothetical protein